MEQSAYSWMYSMYDWWGLHKAEKIRIFSGTTLNAMEVELPVGLLYPTYDLYFSLIHQIIFVSSKLANKLHLHSINSSTINLKTRSEWSLHLRPESKCPRHLSHESSIFNIPYLVSHIGISDQQCNNRRNFIRNSESGDGDPALLQVHMRGGQWLIGNGLWATFSSSVGLESILVSSLNIAKFLS